ncbi:MAG: hypothetical protein HOP19_05715, partial [Acidobacteria bacterium]|nr:hypothetical protein [Acidobacteriota bacterium]
MVVYALSLAAIFTIAHTPIYAQQTQNNAAPQPSPSVKPSFSLQTNRTYGTTEKTRIYISYEGVTALDFRVYKVKDPVKFFRQLEDPHRMGVEERAAVSETYRGKPSFLETLREFKFNLLALFKSYVRTQLRRESRAAFNDQYRSGEQLTHDDATFARMPLLNPDQKVRTFRQVLTPTENRYDTRMVNLGAMPAGVYLVEAVNDKLRAYTIAVVTDLATINKTADDGDMLVFSVDRKTGAPRPETKVEVVKDGVTVAQGVTDKNGILKTKAKKPQPKATPTPTPNPNGEPAPVEEEMEEDGGGNSDFLVMATKGDEFAIAGLSSYYFGGFDDEGHSNNVASYIYTDRPIYRPEQKVYFKGILRKIGENGYEMFADRTVRVSVEDNDGGKLLEKEIPLSARGTFSGEVDLSGAAKLGYYNIKATLNDAEATTGFEVAEYKKPEFKVRVATPQKFVGVGQKTKFTIEAKYFFGSPVANGEVKFYVYRSRYYHWWWAEEDSFGDDEEEAENDEGGYYGYGNDMVKEGEARLDKNGQAVIEFTVPAGEKGDPYDYQYRLEANVTDASRREEMGKASFTGTRGSAVATAEPERYVYYQGDAARIKVRTADYEGKPVSARVALKFVQQTYEKVEKKEDGYTTTEWKLNRKDVGSGAVTTNAQGEATYDWRVPLIGSIRIEAILNENGKEIVSDGGYLYASDRNDAWADNAYRNWDEIKLVPDK